MTETVLFVGGSADGKDIDAWGDYFDIPVPTKLGRERYQRVKLTNGMQDFHVFLALSESPDNLIPLLIEGYRKAK